MKGLRSGGEAMAALGASAHDIHAGEMAALARRRDSAISAPERHSGPITAALQVSENPMDAPCWLMWRAGRKVGRTIYAQVGPEPSDTDHLIGVMDTAELADEVVQSHNACLARAQERTDTRPWTPRDPVG